MKFLENLENGSTNIKKMGIIKALFVMFLSILLEGFGQVPVEFTSLFTGGYEQVVPYVIFVFGVMVKYYVIIILLKWLSNRANEQKFKHYLNGTSFACAALMVIAYRLMFDNSLTLWINTISVPTFINEVIDKLAVSQSVLIFSVVIIAPIYEEIIFRGILLRGMAKKVNASIAIMVSSLLFAIVHMNIPQGINAFFLGLVLGFVYMRSGSIYLSIFAHIVNNVLAISISPLFSLISGKYGIETHRMFLTIGIIFFVIAYDEHNQNRIKNKPNIYKEFLEI